MNQSRIFSFVALAVMVFTLVFGGNIPAAAQIKLPPPPPPGGETLKNQPAKIVQADRQSAAQRAENTGLTTPDVGEADMQMPGSAPRYFSVPNYANSPLPGNIVTQWNAIAQEFLQPTPMPGMPMPMGGISMATSFVYMSYVQAAVYNALVGVEGGYDPYDAVPEIKFFLPVVMGGNSTVVLDAKTASAPTKNTALAVNPAASREAAVATAAFKVLIHYFPLDTTLAPKYADSLAAIPDGPAKTAGIAIGEQAAADIIAIRTGDGLLAASSYTVPAPGPGVWEPTIMPGPIVIPPVDPWMADLKPFLRATPEQYRSVPPPALDDPDYVADLNEVKNIGAAMSVTRTPAQTQVAQFWTTNMVIQSNESYRQLSTSRALNLIETARLMALGNMLATDSLIATFDIKYTYNFWRPITAIRHTNPDGSYSATEINTWMIQHPGVAEAALCQFRQNLFSFPKSAKEYSRLLAALGQSGLFARSDSQSMDAAQVLTTVCKITRLYWLNQGMRAALSALASVAPEWLREVALPHWYEHYKTGQEGAAQFQAEFADPLQEVNTLGADARRLLNALRQQKSLEYIQLDEIVHLSRLVEKQYLPNSGSAQWRMPGCLGCSRNN